jgi:glycosyltransferase involved in cell wall biosynthesis
VVALAPGMQDEIIASGYPADRTSVIPNGSDIDVFAVPPAVGAELRAATPWLADRPLVIYAGTLGVVHNVDYLVALAAAVWRIDAEIRFAIIGGGKQERHVQELARESGVLDRNLFMLGMVAKNAVAAWLSASDISTALASGPEIVWRDSTNNKFFDALAASRPVASNLPGWSARIAEDAGAGITLPFDDIDSAAQMLVAALRDREWLMSAGQAAGRLAHERFDRDLLASQLGRVLEDVVAKHGGDA